MAHCIMPASQIIYDGKDVGIIAEEFGTYYLRDAFLVSLFLGLEREYHRIDTLAGTSSQIPGLQSASISMELRGGLVERATNGGIPYDLQLVRNMKVIDLLTAINKRLRERDKK